MAEENVHHNLLQIMEAQEFRDVAGQMVNKIVNAAVEIESIFARHSERICSQCK